MNQSTIPQQLHNPDFGFVKLLPKSKKPFEKDWPNHPHPLTDIQQWFNEGNNYGVLGGCGNLVIVDADSHEMVTYARGHLPLTFTVKTPKKGVHFYLISPGIDKKIKLKSNDHDHGEIISHGSQVVGPGSTHPDTETAYMVEQNEPIASINAENLLKILADYIPAQDSETPTDNDPAFSSFQNVEEGNRTSDTIEIIEIEFSLGIEHT